MSIREAASCDTCATFMPTLRGNTNARLRLIQGEQDRQSRLMTIGLGEVGLVGATGGGD